MSFNEKNICAHFIGIGGVSMSGLAEYLLSVGFEVSGSDRAESVYTDKLKKLGCKIYIGHRAENVYKAAVVVYSDAVKDDNAELVFARERDLYVLSRAELLAMVADNFAVRIGVCGCHGKTTATCMIAHVMKCAREKFTAHIGGRDVDFGNFISRGSRFFVSEVCEFKKNITRFTADYSLCMSTDSDHLDSYSSEDELIGAYGDFFARSKVAALYDGDAKFNLFADKVVAFGEKPDSKYIFRGVKDDGGRYSFDLCSGGRKLARIRLKVRGRHNMINALGAAAICLEAGISVGAVKRGLEDFRGAERRFESMGTIGKREVVADYAHHPKEISATLSLAREISGDNVTVVFQPHTYTRTLFLKDEFIKVLSGIEDLILYKTYPARETYVKGGSAFDLYGEIGKKCGYRSDADELMTDLSERKGKGLILILGAGDLYDAIKKRLTERE